VDVETSEATSEAEKALCNGVEDCVIGLELNVAAGTRTQLLAAVAVVDWDEVASSPQT